jgi:hypothetical protein
VCLSSDAEGDVCGDTDRTHTGGLLIPDTTCVEGEHDTTLCICIFTRTHTYKCVCVTASPAHTRPTRSSLHTLSLFLSLSLSLPPLPLIVFDTSRYNG